ncbi:GIY-YIG nuclease family protein [Paenibacillus sp. TRM 82003]|nr:GIY-YIG nuclease family protein [Paenibacillus sp. TRM 82003]
MDKERKKELAAQYDLSKRPAGVYRVVHKESGKSFVGATPDLNAMRNRLPFELNAGVSMRKELQADWKRYGAEAFAFEVLETFKPPEDGMYNLKKELERMEAKWMSEVMPYGERGYNGSG